MKKPNKQLIAALDGMREIYTKNYTAIEWLEEEENSPNRKDEYPYREQINEKKLMNEGIAYAALYAIYTALYENMWESHKYLHCACGKSFITLYLCGIEPLDETLRTIDKYVKRYKAA